MRMEEHLSERSWNCLICADGIAYANPSELARHTSENHAEVTADQMATLLDASLVPISNNEFPCPLCRPNGAGSSGEAPADLNHIAEHIHSFALLSLPWAPDVPAVEKKTWQESCQKVVQWLGLNEQATTVFPENPVHQQTTMDETSLYFEKERYFAENARTHSESDGLTSESDRNLGSASPLTMSDNSEERVRRRSDDSPTSPSDAVRVERPSPPPPLRELIVSDNISEIEETGMSEEEKSLLSSTEDATIAQRNASRADAEPSQSLGGIDTSPASSAAMLSQQTPVDIEIPSWLKKSGERKYGSRGRWDSADFVRNQKSV